MDGLFSHAPATPEPPEREGELHEGWADVVVHVPALQAAEGFLDYPHLWWPVNLYSLFGAGSTVFWDGRRLGEESEEGELAIWGETTVWDPPLRCEAVLTSPGNEGKNVAVSFSQEGPNITAVRLGGALPASTPDCRVADDLWEQVLGFYRRFMGS